MDTQSSAELFLRTDNAKINDKAALRRSRKELYMAKDMLNAVTQAESECAEREENARLMAEESENQARQDAARLIEAAKTDAEAQAEKTLEKARQDGELELQRARESAKSKAKEIEKTAAKNRPKVIESATRLLFE